MTPRKRSKKSAGGKRSEREAIQPKPVEETKPPSFSDVGDSFVDSDASDVHKIHLRIVSREQGEPEEGFEPTPGWVWAVSVLLLFAMGFYLGKYSGSFDTVAHQVEQPQLLAGGEVKTEVKGDMVYAGVCQACHQADGKGVEGKYPPLAGSEWLMHDSFTPARIVLYGLEGEILVKGRGFNNKMPQFHDKLSNEEIAAAISFARASFGNNAPAVNHMEVDSMRRMHSGRAAWNSSELAKMMKK